MNRSVGTIDFSLLIFFRNLNSIAKHFYRASTVYSPANFTIIYIYIHSYSFDQIWAKIYTQAACKDINLLTCNDIYVELFIYFFFFCIQYLTHMEKGTLRFPRLVDPIGQYIRGSFSSGSILNSRRKRVGTPGIG